MNKEKIIQKLIKKAEIPKEVEINPENLTEMDLETFYNTYKEKKSDLYYKDGKFYLMHSEGWYMVKISVDLKELEQDVKELKEKVEDLVKFANDIKSYIDDKFDKVKKKK